MGDRFSFQEVVMLKRLGAVAVVFSALSAIAVVVGARAGGAPEADPAGFTAHEWGTFTSIAGVDGQAVQWRPLDGPSDLPCFVTALNPGSVKVPPGGIPALKATVRMETPVLYFYSDTRRTVRASVTFYQGMISEWYPQASVPSVAPIPTMRNALGRIQWDDVRIMPGAKEDYPVEPGESHYYAARATDATPLLVAGHPEKFLFYRGLATFPLLVGATVNRDGNIAVTQSGDRAIDTLILFERRNGRFGYRLVHAGGNDVVIDRPELNATMESMRQELRGLLIERGLYAREAAAMVETWRDSWFEDGARLFYLLPQPAIDGLLPLTIEPKPASVVRVFVGRLEVVTPEIESEVASAIRTDDRTVLRKYGRFLEPMSQIVQERLAARMDHRKVAAAIRNVEAEHRRPAACAAVGARAVANPIP
jgi:hypothetical protein